jgi:hypothetical protein
MLAFLIARAKENDHVDGLILHLVEGGVYILQCVEDKAVAMKTYFMYVRKKWSKTTSTKAGFSVLERQNS